ncbi:MAG TPA: bifunctional DNA-binding transcriptional regulator/O6-methylguanine-DNA methyltransferase Ada [Gemmatimonadaceae bacterium]|nr:bifunctional DNA-binding transcriptional regulator/O6-methylguanine-DNA methyltransferase Ada [Gemmatimonadaceae bacterium]
MSTAPSLPDPATAWRAVERRDRRFDGRFVYGVDSTKIFCRPSCSSRRPTRSRVEFFGSPDDAERAGYRACKRCRPGSDAPNRIDRAVAGAVEHLAAHANERITLRTLAAIVHVSPFHLQRAFKRALGVTPREYQDATRRNVLSSQLKKGDTVSRATFEAGFGSSSRVYERASNELGMTPAVLRKRAAGQRIQFSVVDSSLGPLLAAYTERGVCCVKFGAGDAQLEREFRSEFSGAEIHRAGSTIHDWIAAIVRSVDGGNDPRVPIDAAGTAFQWRVWKELQRIPRGTTLSYTEVAQRIGQPTAVRAVARACATNPVALVIPCHRVIREDGSLGGYRWGLDRKAQLLERERTG